VSQEQRAPPTKDRKKNTLSPAEGREELSYPERIHQPEGTAKLSHFSGGAGELRG